MIFSCKIHPSNEPLIFLLIYLFTNRFWALPICQTNCWPAESTSRQELNRRWCKSPEVVTSLWVSQVALVVKNPPANAGDLRDVGLIPRLGRYPGGGLATHSNILAWKTQWTEEPCQLQSMGSQSQTWLSD